VFFRVLLVGFGLFRPGAARAPFNNIKVYSLVVIEILKNIFIISP
jgi:hypothetical protein